MIEVMKAHTKASDMKIADVVAPPVTARVSNLPGTDITVTETAANHAAIPAAGAGLGWLFDGSQSNNYYDQRTCPYTSGAVTLNTRYEGWTLVAVRYTRPYVSAHDKQTGFKDVRIDFLNDSGVWQALTTITFPYGAYETKVSLLNFGHVVNSKRQYRIAVLNNQWGGTPYINGNEFEFIMGLEE